MSTSTAMPEATPEERTASRRRGALHLLQRVGPVWIAVIVLYVVSGFISPAMFKGSQVLNILQVSAFLGTVALGQTVALLAGGIDLSVAGVVTLTNIVVASVMAGATSRMPLAIAVCVALAVGVGLVNGLLVAVVRITPLIVTLATNSILFGAALVYTQGAPHGSVSHTFATLGQGHLLGFPVSTICWLVVAAVTAWVLRGTTYGRKVYAVGANPRAARVMGVRVGLMLVSAYVMSSVLAAIGGLLLTAYIGLPSLGIGDQFLLTSIAAPVVGGTMLTGGVGSILGTVGGTLFMTELNSFTTIIKVSTGGQYIIQGIIIAVGVMLYPIVSGRRGRG